MVVATLKAYILNVDYLRIYWMQVYLLHAIFMFLQNIFRIILMLWEQIISIFIL